MQVAKDLLHEEAVYCEILEHKSTASRITLKLQVLVRLVPEYIKMPSTADVIAESKSKIYEPAGCPKTIGAIDLKHVRKQPPDTYFL